MYILVFCYGFFFSSRRRHTRYIGDWSSDVCSSDLFCTPGTLSASVASKLATLPPYTGGRATTAYSIPSSRVSMPYWALRSEERRVGKEGRSRWSGYH